MNKKKDTNVVKPLSMLEKQMQQNLKSKIKLSEKRDIDKDDVAAKDKEHELRQQMIRDQEKAQEAQDAKDAAKETAINFSDPKQIAKRVFYGILMGFSDSTPGYSGGTTLTLLNFYNDLIGNIKGIFLPAAKRNWWRHVLWVIPFVVFWALTVVGMFFLIDYASNPKATAYKAGDLSYGVGFVFLFATVALCSIPLYWYSNKPPVPYNKKTFGELKSKNKNPNLNLGVAVLAFVVLIAIGFLVRFVWSADSGGVSMIPKTTNAPKGDIPPVSTDDTILYIAAGFFSGFAMLIPGISGSLVMYLFGSFDDVTHAVSNITEQNSIPIILIVAIGVIIGVITCALSLNWVIKKYEGVFKSMSLGLVAASFITILISLSSNDYAMLSHAKVADVTIGMVFIGFAISGVLMIYLNYINAIDVKLIKFKQAPKQAPKQADA